MQTKEKLRVDDLYESVRQKLIARGYNAIAWGCMPQISRNLFAAVLETIEESIPEPQPEAEDKLAELHHRAALQELRPSVIMEAELTKWQADDGDLLWQASYGDLAGWGETPEEAFADFDRAWQGIEEDE